MCDEICFLFQLKHDISEFLPSVFLTIRRKRSSQNHSKFTIWFLKIQILNEQRELKGSCPPPSLPYAKNDRFLQEPHLTTNCGSGPYVVLFTTRYFKRQRKVLRQSIKIINICQSWSHHCYRPTKFTNWELLIWELLIWRQDAISNARCRNTLLAV